MAIVLLKGNGISPGIAYGKLREVKDKHSALNVNNNDIVFSSNLSPPLASFSRKASGFIIRGSEADHIISYLKEIWKPCVAVESTANLKEGTPVTIDGDSGTIFNGMKGKASSKREPLIHRPKSKIYLQFSIPRLAKEAAKLKTDGVGLLRTNIIIQEMGKHPISLLKKGKRESLVACLEDGIKAIADSFYPKPVWIRTMDFSTNELAAFEGGKNEPKEENPLLGWRGISRELDDIDLLNTEYQAVQKVIESGFDNLGIIYPMLRSVEEYIRAKKVLLKTGLKPHKDVKVGCMFEVPSAALTVNDFIDEGMDFAFVGMNDLTQYTLATDRTNHLIRHLYNPLNKGVLFLLFKVIKECKKNDIETTISYQTPMKEILPELLEMGLSSVTLHVDKINEVGKLLLEIE